MQNFLFKNLPQSRTDRETDSEILKKSKSATKNTTRSVRLGNIPKGSQYASKLAIAVAHARQVLVNDGSIITVQSEKQFFDYIQKIKKNRAGGCDTETTGLDPISDEMVGLCLYTPGEPAIYVPSRHTDIYDALLPDQLSYEVLREGLWEIRDVPLDYHNAVFDWRVIKNSLDVEVTVGWDTQVASNYLNEYESHSLKPLWDKYVSKGADKSATFDDLFRGIPFNYVPIDIATLYGGKDPKITTELADFQRQFLLPDSPLAKEKGLAEAGRFLVSIEIPLTVDVARMENKGVVTDLETAKKLEVKYTARLEEAMRETSAEIAKYDLTKLSPELRSKLNNPINIGSTDQLAIIFYDLLELSNGNRRKPRSTDADALEYMRGKYPEYKAVLDMIQEYRAMQKLLSTYVIKMPREINPKTGRLHARFNQYGARTGRFSSSGPNMQNIPSRGERKEIRKIVKAPEGYVFISADFSQQEPRVLAHLCWMLFNDRGMMDAYLAGKDLYSWMASEIYKVDYDECKEKYPDGSPNPEGKRRRDSVKSILLGLMYGMQIDSLAENLGLTKDEAQQYMDLVFDTFPAIKQVVDYYQDMARRDGFITTVYGRKCRLPDMQLPEFEFVYTDDKTRYIEDETIIAHYSERLNKVKYNKDRRAIWEEANDRGIWIIDNRMKISDAERQVLNSVVQGTSADITKLAMRAIGSDEKLREWKFEMTLSIHDEIDGECPEENAPKVMDRVSELMIGCCADRISVPMKVDVDCSREWTGEDIADELRQKYAS